MERSVVRSLMVLVGLFVAVQPVQAQGDSVRLVGGFRPGLRPGVMVLSGPGLDVVRSIVNSDLAQSDRFELANLADSLSHLTGAFDAAPYKASKPNWAVELQPAGPDVEVRLHNLQTGVVVQQGRYPVDRNGVGDTRLAIHQISDHIVMWATGGIGIAATRILYLQDPPGEAGIFRIDADGENRVRVSPKGVKVMMPAWLPDATRVAYSDWSNSGNTSIVILTLASGNRVTVTTTSEYSNTNAAFARDGRKMAFVKAGDNDRGGEIWTANTANLASIYNAVRLTSSGRNAENVAPTFHPDGQFIAFETNRGGKNEIWVMDADGSSPHRLFVFEGKAHEPNWSPDGSKVAFTGEVVDGVMQVYYYDVLAQRTTLVTSAGRNEDASWAPDSRHLVFRRTQGGKVRLYIKDTETGETRPIDTPGDARYPAWSPTIAGNTP